MEQWEISVLAQVRNCDINLSHITGKYILEKCDPNSCELQVVDSQLLVEAGGIDPKCGRLIAIVAVNVVWVVGPNASFGNGIMDIFNLCQD